MRIAIVSDGPEQQMRAATLAAELDRPLLALEPAARDLADSELDLVLAVTAGGLELRIPGTHTTPIRADPARLGALRKGRDDLVRAVVPSGERPWRVVDATAGVGVDGFHLAAAGAHVTMVERSDVLFVLLRDAWNRGLADPTLHAAAQRVQVLHGDALDWIPRLPAPDVVYLDPMYPDRGKSAAKSKEMRLLRELVGGDADAVDLFSVAQSRAQRRVVVKRPAKAPPLGGPPSGAIGGRSVRFDLYPPGGTLEPSG